MPLRKSYLAAALALGLGSVQAMERTPEIINGSDAKPGAWPWMVSIHFNATAAGEHGCGGALIAPTWVLTAAHCLDNETAQNLVVYSGLHQQSQPGTAQRLPVTRFVQHPGWNPQSPDLFHDVALLELAEASTQPTVLLNAGGSLPGSATVLGWGLTSVGGAQSDILQELPLPLVDNATCLAAYRAFDPNANISNDQICAGYYEGGRDSCQGDSGGPLMIRNGGDWQQVGVVSYGVAPDGTPCAGQKSYGVYARVSAYLNFIAQYVPQAIASLAGEAVMNNAWMIHLPGVNFAGQQVLWAKLQYVPQSNLDFWVVQYGVLGGGATQANLSADLVVLDIPALTWAGGRLRAQLRLVPGVEPTFQVVDYAPLP